MILTIRTIAAFQLATMNFRSGAGVRNATLDIGNDGFCVWEIMTDAGSDGLGVCNAAMNI